MYFKRKISLDAMGVPSTSLILLGHVSGLSAKEESHEKQQNLLLERYVKEGDACFSDLEGSFVLIIPEKYCIKVVTDRVASRKLFYYFDSAERKIYLSERLKGLIEMDITCHFDRISLYEFCCISYILGNKTLFTNIYEVKPASILKITPEGIKETAYWQPIVQGYVNYDISEDEVIDAFHGLWIKEIERLACYSDEFIVPLSGGMDSRLIVDCLLRHVPASKILTYTFGDHKSMDYKLGKLTAAFFGCKNVAVPPIVSDIKEQIDYLIEEFEGLAESLPYFPLPFSRFIPCDTRTVVSGYIGDVLAGSKTKKQYLGKKADTEEELAYAIKKDIVLNDDAMVAEVLDLAPEDIQVTKIFKPTSSSRFYTDSIEEFFYYNRGPKLISCVLFPEKNRFDYHLPFISRDIFHFTLSIPARYKIDRNFFLNYVRKYYPKSAAIPTKAFWGVPLDSKALHVLYGMLLTRGRNYLNRIALQCINRALFLDPYINYVDYFHLYNTNENFRRLVKESMDKLRERPFIRRNSIDKIVNSLERMTTNQMALVKQIIQLEFIAQFYGIT